MVPHLLLYWHLLENTVAMKALPQIFHYRVLAVSNVSLYLACY